MKKFLLFPLLSVFALAAVGCSGPETPIPEANNSESEVVRVQTDDPNNLPSELMQTKPEKGDPIAILTTNYGEIRILLYEKTPETYKNFVEHAKTGRFDNTIFHRVINNFMIQGGDFENRNGTGGYSYKGKGTTIKNEIAKGLEHIRGAVSMANRGPDTNGSQFFVVQREGGVAQLNGDYTVFGYAYEGMDVVDEIAAVKTDADDKPVKDVILEKVEISQYE